MERGRTGHLEVVSDAGETTRAFVPYPLPPDPPLELGDSAQQWLERALLACGRLDGLGALLPDPDLFLYSYVRREAVLSSQIEGTQSSLSDLLLFELDDLPGVPFDDVVEVSNYVAALQHGLDRLRNGFPLSSRLLREVHGVLLSRGRGADQQPGEFRRSQNWIGGTRAGNAAFVPPPAARVADCVSDLERFIHADDTRLPALIRAALAHVQFETIHPFLDGNGRVGRLLIVLMLQDAGVLRQPLLYLSLFFKQHRQEYYRLLDRVRREGDWEAWVAFFLEGVAETAGGAVATAQQLVERAAIDARRVETLGRRAPSALRVFEAFRSRPLRTVANVARFTGLSVPTVSKRFEELVELGILRELTGRRRNRVFAYDEYLRVLGQGTEPL
jgi:Fic family protein